MLPASDLTRRFVRFAELECRDSSPLYERLSLAVADDPEVLALAAQTPPAQPVPNLLFAAVHRLLLAGADHPLAAFYPSITPEPDATADPYPAFRDFCLTHVAAIREMLMTRLVQTNEVRRCALLRPAFAMVADLAGSRPLALVEVGASAGLNLLPDRYGYTYQPGGRRGDATSPVQLACRAHGPHLPPLPAALPPIVSRTGIDLHPIDVRDEEAIQWLRALIWPEHQDRADLLARAVAVARDDPPRLIAGDAIEHLPEVLDTAPAGAALCVVHTHTLNQFTPEARARLTDLLAAFGARRTIYRISIADLFLPIGGEPSLGLVVYDRGGARERLLAACDPHGRWLAWQAPPD